MDQATEKEMKEIVKGILERGYLMSLATADEAGPWIAEIVYVSDDCLSIYWISDANSRHSKAIAKNPRVAGAITISDRPGQPTEAIQISGIAKVLEGNFPELSKKRSAKLMLPGPINDEQILVYNDKRYGGKHCWFKMTPTKFDILYKKRFGDDKAVLQL